MNMHQIVISEELRTALALALTGVVSYFITEGLKSLSALIAEVPWLQWVNISGWGSFVTAFAVTGVMFYFDMGLAMVPSTFNPFAPIVIQFLIALLSAVG